ncbi:MAG TPA: DNA gyrase modulator, partial [Candidatus Acidoferrales bacterium]|nr:DNA gyrase modulator [Candidatus Acidoferrales bacterium]
MHFDAESQRVLDTAAGLGAEYADVRFAETRDEHIEVRNGIVNSLSDGESAGFSVRALVNGAWGFASSAQIDDAELDRVAALAVSIARASGRVKGQAITLVPSPAYTDSYKTPFETDPATIPLGDRVNYLLAVEKEVRAAKGVTVARAWMDIWRTKKFFANTDGSKIEQELLQCGSALHALAVGEGDVQDRCYPGT